MQMSLMTVADFGHKRLWMIMESVDDRGVHRLLLMGAIATRFSGTITKVLTRQND